MPNVAGDPYPPLRRLEWRPAWRIISSRYPPVDLFERLAPPADWEALIALESLTNPRLRQECGDISLVEPAERVHGPGMGYVMAAFTHLNPEGSRFSDGTYGVLYAGREIETAIAETRHHRQRFLARTPTPPTELHMRVLVLDIAADLHDLADPPWQQPEVLDPDSYGAARQLGRRLRAEGSWGVRYPSVRQLNGQCVGVFRPRAVRSCTQERHLAYEWDGAAIVRVRALS